MRSVLFFALVSAAACSPYDPDLGDAPFLCGPVDQNPRCPDGYTCLMDSNGMEYCLAPAAMAPVDANNLNCANDSNLEGSQGNDTIGTAWQAPDTAQWPPTQPPTTPPTRTFRLAGLAICPSGDKDTYSIRISTQGENLEMLLSYDAAGADLQGSLLNQGGTPIANAGPVTGMAGLRRAYVANLPAGIYYASVYGPADAQLTTNNYSLTFNVTGP